MKRCYLNVPEKEAIKRYRIWSENNYGWAEKDPKIDIIDFEDEFDAFDIHKQKKCYDDRM